MSRLARRKTVGWMGGCQPITVFSFPLIALMNTSTSTPISLVGGWAGGVG